MWVFTFPHSTHMERERELKSLPSVCLVIALRMESRDGVQGTTLWTSLLGPPSTLRGLLGWVKGSGLTAPNMP